MPQEQQKPPRTRTRARQEEQLVCTSEPPRRNSASTPIIQMLWARGEEGGEVNRTALVYHGGPNEGKKSRVAMSVSERTGVVHWGMLSGSERQRFTRDLRLLPSLVGDGPQCYRSRIHRPWFGEDRMLRHGPVSRDPRWATINFHGGFGNGDSPGEMAASPSTLSGDVPTVCSRWMAAVLGPDNPWNFGNLKGWF